MFIFAPSFKRDLISFERRYKDKTSKDSKQYSKVSKNEGKKEMNYKRFKKVRKVSEERMFRDDDELTGFIKKQNGISSDKIYGGDALSLKEYLVMHYPFMYGQDIFVAGDFLFRITRGQFTRIIDGCETEYMINVLAEQNSRKLSRNDLRELFKEWL
jgi:hypothetical protein